MKLSKIIAISIAILLRYPINLVANIWFGDFHFITSVPSVHFDVMLAVLTEIDAHLIYTLTEMDGSDQSNSWNTSDSCFVLFVYAEYPEYSLQGQHTHTYTHKMHMRC